MSQDVYCRYIDGVFSPSEVEAMTDIPPTLQRTWRLRGFLSREVARASLSGRDVAQIMALKFASQTIPVELKFVHKAIAAAVPSILWFALSERDAWDVRGSTPQKQAFWRALGSDNKKALVHLDKTLALRPDQFGRFLLIQDERPSFVGDLDDAFPESSPVGLVLDLISVGRALVESRERPRALMIAAEIDVGKKPVVRAP